MNRTVEKGKTLIVDGPASVTLNSGRAEVFGASLRSANKVVIREGKRLPFAVEETAIFDISLGENAVAEEFDGSTIPPSCTKSYEELPGLQTKPITAIVLGTVDSGKTSFCTYLINRLLHGKRRVAILDGDLGQSDIGPPCTLAYAFVTKPVTDLFDLKEKDAFFVGATSPSGQTEKVVEGLTSLKKKILSSEPDVILIDTDGWVEGEDATNYKIQLTGKLQPDIIFWIQQKDELAPILGAFGECKNVLVDSPPVIGQRNREKRRNLRELGYVKYLRNSKVQSLPLNWTKIEGDELFGLGKMHENARQARKIYELLGMKPLHFAELPDRVCIVIGRRRWIEPEKIKRVEEFSKKRVVLIRKGNEEGLLVALHNSTRQFLGIGVLQEIDFTRKYLKVSTPVSDNIAIVNVGKVKLDKNMREISILTEENHLDFPEFKNLF